MTKMKKTNPTKASDITTKALASAGDTKSMIATARDKYLKIVAEIERDCKPGKGRIQLIAIHTARLDEELLLIARLAATRREVFEAAADNVQFEAEGERRTGLILVNDDTPSRWLH